MHRSMGKSLSVTCEDLGNWGQCSTVPQGMEAKGARNDRKSSLGSFKLPDLAALAAVSQFPICSTCSIFPLPLVNLANSCVTPYISCILFLQVLG